MKDLWFISDTHFNHSNILKFVNSDGSLVRPGFADLQEMNEKIIQNYNSVVRPGHHVYFCGDVFFGDTEDISKIIGRLNGRKRLILGNHDDIIKQRLTDHFEKIMLWRHFKEQEFLVSHIPLPPEQWRYKAKANVHGHLHNNVVVDENNVPDRRYINVCVEHTNYTPIHIDELAKKVKKL